MADASDGRSAIRRVRDARGVGRLPRRGDGDLVAALARRLGLVHRDVGVAEQVVDAAASPPCRRRCRCSPRRYTIAPATSTGASRAPSRRCDDGRRVRRRRGCRSSRMPNSSPPRRAARSVVAQAAAEPLADGDQQVVAGRVTEAVVDGLEVVEVEEQGRDGPGAVPRGQGRLGLARRSGGGWRVRSAGRGTPGSCSRASSTRRAATSRSSRPTRPARRTSTRSDRRAVPRATTTRPLVGVRPDAHEQRAGDHRHGEADQADRAEPRHGDRMRIGQSSHRRMGDGRPERAGRRRGTAMSIGPPDDVRLVERSGARRSGRRRGGVTRLAPSRRNDGRPGARRREQAHRHADRGQVRDRIGEA